jgi:hypothetical protein
MRIRFPGQAFVLGGFVLAMVACGSVSGIHPDAGTATGGTSGSGGKTGAGGNAAAGGNNRAGGNTAAGVGGMTTGVGGSPGAGGGGGTSAGFVVHAGITTLGPATAATSATFRVVNPRLSAPGPTICSSSFCLSSGGIVP